ncbi:uncharacterized protein ACIBXB_006307 [Morphnus guianensis]
MRRRREGPPRSLLPPGKETPPERKACMGCLCLASLSARRGVAREHKGTGRALTGCGQELLRLKLERPEKGREEEMEGWPATRPAAASRCRQEGACLSACGRIPLRSPQQVRPPGCTAGSVRSTDGAVRPRGVRASEAPCLGSLVLQDLRDTCSPRGRTAVQPELQQRRGAGEEHREASELAKSPGSAKKQSCA